MNVKTAIQNGDGDALWRLLQENPARANELMRWGAKEACLAHPLHYISDVLFEGKLPGGSEIALIGALVEAGADFQRDRDGGKKGDTPLIGATSLGAENAGIRLSDAGARPELRRLFGETALHWVALPGGNRLAALLIEGSDLNLDDEKYKSPPLGGRYMASRTSLQGTRVANAKWSRHCQIPGRQARR